MPKLKWLAGITEGLATEKMSIMVFSESEYSSDVSYTKWYQSKIKSDNLLEVHVTDL